MIRLLVLGILTACPLFAATYYVSPDGSDNNDGSLNAPWASPAWATRQMAGGDELILLPGTYVLRVFDTDILSPPSGSEDKYTLIHGSKKGDAVLAGADNLYAMIDLSGKHHLEIYDLELTHHNEAYARDGINGTAAPCSDIILRNLHIHHLDEFGINLRDVQNMLVDSCNIHHCGFGAAGGPQAGEGGGWINAQFEHSQLSWSGHYYQNGDTDNPYSRPDGFGIEPGPGPIRFINCTLEHNVGDGLDSKSDTTIVQNCVIANNRTDGLKLWGSYGRIENTLIYGRGDGDSTPTPWSAVVIDTQSPNAAFEFVHCTIDDALGHNYCMWAQYDHPDVPIDLNMVNTIVSSRGPSSSMFLGDSVQFTLRYSLFWMPENDILLQHGNTSYDQTMLTGIGEQVLVADPHFLLPAWGTDGDYHLSPSSAAIDAGLETGLSVDLEGQSRSLGSAPDMGAYENTQPINVQARQRSNRLRNRSVICYPNPANPETMIHFFIPTTTNVELMIYDIRGRRVRTLVRGTKIGGDHVVRWDGTDFTDRKCPTGFYIANLHTTSAVKCVRISLVR